MQKALILTGQRFGRLLVLGPAPDRVYPSGNRHKQWQCQCDCGTMHITTAGCLRSGQSRSCGCLHHDIARHRLSVQSFRHGHSKNNAKRSREYRSWEMMKQRCLNPKNANYPNYGGRGILVCERWRDSFENFLTDMGPCPKRLTINRIDNNGNYEPDNCHWATRSEQRHNQRPDRLSKDEVFSIRQRAAAGESAASIARGYPDCHYQTIYAVVSRRSWHWLGSG